MPKMKYSGEHTVLTYAYLRHSSKCVLEITEENEEGNVHTSMSSLILSAFSLEASLNHIGEKLFPFWKEVEKNLSPESKLDFICHDLKITPDFSKKPYQSFRKVLKFRNKLAHGKTETVKGSWSGKSNDKPISQIETEWQKMCTPKTAKKIFDDITEIVTKLHKAAGMGEYPFLSIGHGSSVGKLQLPTLDKGIA